MGLALEARDQAWPSLLKCPVATADQRVCESHPANLSPAWPSRGDDRELKFMGRLVKIVDGGVVFHSYWRFLRNPSTDV